MAFFWENAVNLIQTIKVKMLKMCRKHMKTIENRRTPALGRYTNTISLSIFPSEFSNSPSFRTNEISMDHHRIL